MARVPCPGGSVLVTRPEGQSDGLCRSLREAGYNPLHQAMMVIEPCADLAPEQRQAVMDLDLFQHIIFVSVNAVISGMEWIDRFWPQYPLAVNWFTVGATSATRLRTYGLDVLHPTEQMDSDGLLALPELQEVSGQRILIVKGEGGRTRMREELARRGARVQELECYRRRGPDLDADQLKVLLADQKLTAVMVSSGEGLDNMLLLLDEELRTLLYGIALVVPGQRVAQKARDLGFTSVLCAANATDNAMMKALQGQD